MPEADCQIGAGCRLRFDILEHYSLNLDERFSPLNYAPVTDFRILSRSGSGGWWRPAVWDDAGSLI